MSNTSDTKMHANHGADANLHGEKDYQTMDHSKDLNGKKPSYKDLAVEFCGIKMKNPIVAASGTSGSVLNMPIILTSATKWAPFR